MQLPHEVSRIISAANTTNATLAKGSSGLLYAITGYNAAAAVRYLKLYNKATAPTVGTDTPLMTIALPATTAFAIPFATPLAFTIGIGYGLTVLGADADATAVTAADIVGLNIVFH